MKKYDGNSALFAHFPENERRAVHLDRFGGRVFKACAHRSSLLNFTIDSKPAILVCVDSFGSTECSAECICATPAEYGSALLMITTVVAMSVLRFPLII
jgi:hypothetical protein